MIGKMVAASSWFFILVIMMGAVTGVFKSSFTTWFGFVFFLLSFIISVSLTKS